MQDPRTGTPREREPRGLTLVSGGAGFIGSALVAELLERGEDCLVVDDLSAGTWARMARIASPDRAAAGPWIEAGAAGSPRSDAAHSSRGRVRFLRRDVTDLRAWREGLADAGRVTRVVHLAGRVGVRRVLADPEGCHAEQLAAAKALIAAITELPRELRPRVFAASSSEVYAEKFGPLDESAPLRSPGDRGRWSYASSKSAAERSLAASADLWRAGDEPVHLRFFNVVGPGQDARTGMVMPTFIEHALRGAPLPVHGSGDQVRTFGHVDDIARALAEAVTRTEFPGGALNLGGRVRASVRELAQTIVGRAATFAAGERRSIVFVDPKRRLGPQFEEVAFREPDLSRAARLGLPLPHGTLEELVDDCLARHSELRIDREEARLERPVRGGAQGPREEIGCGSPGS